MRLSLKVRKGIVVIICAFIIGFVFQNCQNSKEEKPSNSLTIGGNSSNALGVGRSAPSEVYKRLIKQVEDTVAIDLSEIRERGTLKVITISSAISYFRYMKKWMGYEYEMAQLLAKKLNLKLEIIEAKNINDMIYKLRKGEGDVIAYQMPYLEGQEVNFNYVISPLSTRQVVIQKKPANWRNMTQEALDSVLLRSLEDLNGKSIRIQNDDLVEENLINFFEEKNIAVTINRSVNDYSDEELIFRVLNGKIKYAVVNSFIANFQATYFGDLSTDLKLSEEMEMGWVVRKKSTDLLAALSQEFSNFIAAGKFQEVYDKYFKEKKVIANFDLNDKYYKSTGDLSPFDSIVKSNALDNKLDWRLLTAQMYQESEFDPDVESWAGAVGLMQFMPKTAEEYEITNRRDPVQSIEGGATFLNHLNNRWKKQQVPPDESIKFALASYNVGIGHVMDAAIITEDEGADKTKWINVSQNLLKLSKREYINYPKVKYGYCNGREPIDYVERIMKRYQIYSKLKPIN
jgi:membrane-bound lytic murein transglycosylase F